MTVEIKKASPLRLRSIGLDEKWLQDRIEEDPSILRLGDLQILRREKAQQTGGRIDFLMFDPDQEVRYEIEVMLGALDESHIIRTIEYWDIERQRYPSHDHRAVIVAEEITARFFNVIRLLNRAIPLIALQLSAFTFDNSVVLHVTKVLDIYEEAEPEEDTGGEQADRRYWERRANTSSLAVVDKLVGLVQSADTKPRVTYNKYHIALGTTGYNFCWFHPRKEASHCLLDIRVGADGRDDIVGNLEDAGLHAKLLKTHLITVKLTLKDLEANAQLVTEVLHQSGAAFTLQFGRGLTRKCSLAVAHVLQGSRWFVHSVSSAYVQAGFASERFAGS